MADLPVFPFSPNAYTLGLFTETEGICDACGKNRTLRYTPSFYSVEETEYLCPWCIADGTAARVFDGEFNDWLGIEGIPVTPDIPVAVDEDDARVVSTRTPSYSSWQQEQWLSHCGRPCAFLGYIGASGLERYLDEPDFAADVDGGTGVDRDIIMAALTESGDLAGYLFRCLDCGAHRLHVDMG